MAFYLICAIIYFLLLVAPIYPLVLFKKKLFIKKIYLLKKLSFASVIIIIICAILINLITFLNISNLFSFYKECPYNYSYNDIATIFGINYQGLNTINSYTEKCSDNRCLLIEENLESSTNYTFLCNFDSAYDFQSFKNKLMKTVFFSKIKEDNNSEIICRLFNNSEFDNEDILLQNDENYYILKSYYNICSSEKDFYKCNRYEKPNEYEIDYDFSCPTISDNIVAIIIAIISFFFNLILSITISIIKYIKYD